MTSLKEKLNQLIKSRGYVSSAEIYEFCQREGMKLSNAERRLRKSESPDIIPVMAKSKRGTNYIQGYKYKKGIVYYSGEIIEIKVDTGQRLLSPSNLSVRKRAELEENQRKLF